MGYNGSECIVGTIDDVGLSVQSSGVTNGRGSRGTKSTKFWVVVKHRLLRAGAWSTSAVLTTSRNFGVSSSLPKLRGRIEVKIRLR